MSSPGLNSRSAHEHSKAMTCSSYSNSKGVESVPQFITPNAASIALMLLRSFFLAYKSSINDIF